MSAKDIERLAGLPEMRDLCAYRIDHGKCDFPKAIRAILQALREPSEVLHYSDCALHLAPAYKPEDCDCGALLDWQAMIDHLLAD